MLTETDDIYTSEGAGWQPSAILSINGQDTDTYLTQFASLNAFGYLESNAEWNSLMYR